MKFKEIISKITGISCPVFGISWDAPNTERQIARNTIIFLEQKRVLYNDYELEVASHCTQSVIQIREFLTEQLEKIKENSNLYEYISAMRKSCNKFLNNMHIIEREYHSQNNINFCSIDGWKFIVALGELRGLFGVMIMQIATTYGLDVENDLANILPI